MQIDSDQIDNNGKDAVYSYPPIDTIFYPENGKKLKESLDSDPSQVSQIYADCKAQKKPIISYAALDAA